MRRLLTCAVIAAATLTAPSSHAAPADIAQTRLFLHSASGSYAQDAIGTQPYGVPVGSTMSADKPARASSATASHRPGPVVPGLPTLPTFGYPLQGTIRSMCIDLFISSARVSTSPPGPDGFVYVNTKFFRGGATGLTFETNAQTFQAAGTGVQRLTGWAPAKGEPFSVEAGQAFTLYGMSANNPDWTLFYDSAEHFSSITVNVPKEKCVPGKLEAPK